MNNYLFVVLFTALSYLVLITLTVFLRKKELSQLTIIDFVFVALLGNSVQDAMVKGEWNVFLIGASAAVTLFGLDYVMTDLIFASKTVRNVIEGEPVILVHNGKILHKNMRKEKVTTNELEAALRANGLENVNGVRIAMLETDGNINVITSDNQKAENKKREKN
jgi:uncharacterized membrane protein YcaP (DUF421 family)